MLNTRTSWMLTAVAYVAVIGFVLTLMMNLASGYSGKFLGIWIPPNSVEFRKAVGIGSLVLYALFVFIGGLVSFRGTGWARVAAAGSVLLGLGMIVFAVFGYFF